MNDHCTLQELFVHCPEKKPLWNGITENRGCGMLRLMILEGSRLVGSLAHHIRNKDEPVRSRIIGGAKVCLGGDERPPPVPYYVPLTRTDPVSYRYEHAHYWAEMMGLLIQHD
jgi:hypothetical protein